MRSELSKRCRQPREPLPVLANDIESLTHGHNLTFPLRAERAGTRPVCTGTLSYRGLRTQTQLAHPESLQNSLEVVLEREIVWAGVSAGTSARHVWRYTHCVGLWCKTAQSRKSLHVWLCCSTTDCIQHSLWPHGLLGVWPARPSVQGLRHVPRAQGNGAASA